MRRNRGVILTCRVGHRMPIRHKRVSRRISYVSFKLENGPLAGGVIKLAQNTGNKTLPIVVRGQAGHYHCTSWVPSPNPIK